MIGLRVVLGFTAWCVLPGLAAAALMCRRERVVTPPRFLVLALASGVSIWFLGSAVLARVSVLSPAVVAVTAVVLAVGSIVVLVGPGRAGLVAGAGAAMRAELPFLLLAVGLGALPVLVLVAHRPDSVIGTTPWYYLQLARDVAVTHGVPAVSPEWATRLPFLDDYPGFTAGTAVLLSIGGVTKSLAAIQLIRVVAVLTAGVAAYLLARVLGAARSAACIAVLLFFVGDTFVDKLSSFRPEAAGYALLFLAAALAKLWIDHRRVADLVLTALTLLALGEVHGIVWTLAAAVVAGVALGAIVAGPERRQALRSTAILGAAAVGSWVVGNVALGGGLSGASKLGGLPEVKAGVDPTLLFLSLRTGRLVPGQRPSVPQLATNAFGHGFVGLTRGWYWLAAAATLLVLIGVIAWGRVAARRASVQFLVMSVVAVGALVLAAVWFTVNWDTWVPLRTGWSRMVPLSYALLPFGVALALSGVSASRVRRIATAAVAVVAIVLMAQGFSTIEHIGDQQPSRATLTALRNADLGADDLVLTNTYSEGLVRGVLGARGVLDGRAPFTERTTLARANDLLEQSVKFFADPERQPLPPRAGKIDYVLVATGPEWSLATPFVFPTKLDALDQRSDLRLVRQGPGFRLYAVETAP